MTMRPVTGRRVALLALAAFVAASDATPVAALLRQIPTTLSASPAAAGQAVMVYAAGYAVGAPLIIRLVRRARQDRLLTGCARRIRRRECGNRGRAIAGGPAGRPDRRGRLGRRVHGDRRRNRNRIGDTQPPGACAGGDRRRLLGRNRVRGPA
jgi:MFS family permease